ncbi:MAG: glucokinase [Planctomycetota bacterium]
MRLAADVGGTKTALALIDANGAIARTQTLPSAAYDSVQSLIAEFIEDSPSEACFAVAGPIRDGRAHLTNLGWVVDPAEFGFRLRLIHDVAAVAYAIPDLETELLQKGDPDPEGAIGIVAPGTGLGFAISVGGQAAPSEAGHATFAPINERERAWSGALSERFGRVSRERACSGSTYPLLQEFCGDDASSMFAEMLGAIAGDWALSVCATGGIYLTGGMAPRALASDGFIEAFLSKGRFRSYLERIPIHLVRNEDAALRGAIAALDR